MKSFLLLSAAVLVSGVALQLNAGCDDLSGAPCNVTRNDVLLDDPGITNGHLVRSGGKLYASWERHELIDAGGKAGLDLTGFDVAVIEDTGLLGQHTFVPAPLVFRARAASVEDPSVSIEDGAEMAHWVETTTTTEPNGLVRTASALKFAYVNPPTSVTVPPLGSCEKCVVTARFAALADQTYVFVRIDPDLADASRDLPPATFHTLRLRRDGSVTEVPTPWLITSAELASDGGEPGLANVTATPSDLQVEVDPAGRILVSVVDRVWLLDSSMKLIAGPIALPPDSDARVRFNSAGNEASIAWSVSPFDEGRIGDNVVRREVFVGLVPPGTSAVQTRERTSRGREVLGFDRNETELATVFESAGRILFAAVDPHGVKRGGDLLIAGGTPGGSEYGTPTIVDDHAVIARGNGVYHVATLGSGALSVAEIHCGP